MDPRPAVAKRMREASMAGVMTKSDAQIERDGESELKWFGLQVAFGLSWMSGGAGMEGVASLGHVGGYVAGLAFALLLGPGRHRYERR